MARATVASLPEAPAVIVVAVKPQVMDEVFPPLARLAGKGTVVLSIAAGPGQTLRRRPMPYGQFSKKC